MQGGRSARIARCVGAVLSWGLALVQIIGVTLWYAASAIDLDLRRRDAFFEAVGTYFEPYRTAAWLLVVGALSILTVRNARRASAASISEVKGTIRASLYLVAAIATTLVATTAVTSRPGELAVESGSIQWQDVLVGECAFPLSASRFVVRAGDRTLFVPWLLPLPVDAREWRSRFNLLACK